MKFKTIIISISVVLLTIGQLGCGDLYSPIMPKISTPTGKFQADHWIDLTTFVSFGEPTVEEREDGTYILSSAGEADSFIIMNFADGSTLQTTIMNRWDAGGGVTKVVEADPETDAPIHDVRQTEGTWEMYTEAGQMLFTGAFHVIERHFYYENGVPVKVEDVQPATGEAEGVGPYEGHVLVFEESYYSLEMRDDKPFLHGVWKSAEIR